MDIYMGFWRRLFRKITGRDKLVRSGFLVKFSGRNYRKRRKRYPNMYNDMFIDKDDKDQIYQLFNEHIVDPNIKIYVTYNDGSTRRVKVEGYKRHRIKNFIDGILLSCVDTTHYR